MLHYLINSPKFPYRHKIQPNASKARFQKLRIESFEGAVNIFGYNFFDSLKLC